MSRNKYIRTILNYIYRDAGPGRTRLDKSTATRGDGARPEVGVGVTLIRD